MASTAAAHDEATHPIKHHANQTGLTKIQLENTWWGKESLGTWGDNWWVEIKAETEKAILCGKASDKSRPTPDRMKTLSDAWVPKSKITSICGPSWERAEADGESKGELTLGSAHLTRYGKKLPITGDTYAAMKEDGLSDELKWEDTHCTWNGNEWEIDANEEAVEALTEEANALGYDVLKLP